MYSAEHNGIPVNPHNCIFVWPLNFGSYIFIRHIKCSIFILREKKFKTVVRGLKTVLPKSIANMIPRIQFYIYT